MPASRKPIVLLPHRRRSGLFLRDGEYVADINPDSGGRTIRKLGTDRKRALKLWDDLVVELDDRGRDVDDPLLATFLVEVFLPTQRRLKAFEFCQTAVRGVVRFLEADETMLRIRAVRPYHVERLRAFYGREEYSPRTINAYTQKLSQALNHAVDLDLLAANPLARMRQLTVDNRRAKFLAMEDFVRILDAAKNTDARDLFLIMGLTGLRPSNVRLLTVDELDGSLLSIPPEKMKNARRGMIPLSRYVAARLLERADGKAPEAPLFPAKWRPDGTKSADNLSRSFRSLVRRLDGLEWSSLYDLRHFFASQLAKQGANEQQIGRLLCHVGQSVTSRYVHQDIEDLRHFVDELAERYLQAAGTASLPYRRERDDEERITA